MKRILTLFILTLAFLGKAQAQGMQVEHFRLLENDLTATLQGTSRKDHNGETAALIKMVSPEKGFTFDGGALGIVGTDDTHAGETWIYVPRSAQRLTISHKYFGVLRNYVYPITVEGGRTYEMLLDIGTGRYVTLTTQMAGAEVTIDGKHAGKAPLYNRYLNFGPHKIEAVAGRHEGTLDLEVTQETAGGSVVNVPMQDMSHTFGEVIVTTTANTDILFQGRKVGTGRWRTQLKEGSYSVVTARADCDSALTSFTVKRRQNNDVQATPPTPHTGYLQVYTRPRNVQAVYDGRTPIDLTQVQTLPVGRHELQFTRKGYVSQSATYQIRRNQTVRDTVQLERVTYVRPLAFYFGAAYTAATLGGVTGVLGAVFHRHDLQLSYTFGLTESDPVYCYNDAGRWLATMTYRQSTLSARYGYQLNLMRQLAITPQVGYSLQMLGGSADAGEGSYGDGGKASSLTLGVKLLLVPMQHCYVFAAPEFGVALSQDTYYKHAADIAGFSAGGFAVSAGVLFSF